MKKFISLMLALIMTMSLFVPAFASAEGDKNLITLVVPEDWELNVGDSRSVEGGVDSEITNRVLTWETGDEIIATVDKWGRVTAVSKGETSVKASTSDGLEHTVFLKVTNKPTKMNTGAKPKHDYEGESVKENDVLQKIVTRFAKDNSKEVPKKVKDEKN